MLSLHLEPGEADELKATLVLAGELGRIPLGPARVTPEGLEIAGLRLACEDECTALVGVLPRALVPLYDVPVRFERSGPPEEAPPTAAPQAPPPAWTAEVGGAVWAPLGVDETRELLFVATDSGSLWALSARDGSTTWKRDLASAVRAAPTLDGDSLLVHTDGETIHRLDAATGEAIWSRELGVEPTERLGPDAPGAPWDFYASAVAATPERLFVGTRAGTVHALSAADGAELWRTDAGAAVTATPLALTDRIVVATLGGRVLALDPADGRVLWDRDLGGGIPADPVMVDGRIWVGTRAYEIQALDPADGATAWTRYLWFSWVDSSPTVRDGVAYSGSSDALEVLALDPAHGSSLWEASVPGWAWATPAVTASTVVAGTVGTEGYMGPRRGSLSALDRESGALRWRLQLPPPAEGGFWGIASAPAVLGERLFAATLDGTVLCFGPSDPR
ncbi:MAG: PQQ-binding-like beta-propeller repeat protein [Thermoanaerobaculia bacterium]